MPDSDAQLEILRLTLEACSKEGDALADTWKVLETKAQATVVTAGIFITAIVSVTNDTGTSRPPIASLVLVVSLLSLGLAIWCAVLALLVRSVTAHPGAKEYDTLALDLLGLPPEEIRERLPGFYQNAIILWRQSSEEHRRANDEKADYLSFSQLALFMASVLAALLAVVRLGQ